MFLGILIFGTIQLLPIYFISWVITKIAFRHIIKEKEPDDEIAPRLLYSILITIFIGGGLAALIANVPFFTNWFSYAEIVKNELVLKIISFGVLNLILNGIISYNTDYKYS